MSTEEATMSMPAQPAVRTGGAPAARVGWIDDARGIGIFLVVVGHTLGGLRSASVLADGGGVSFAIDWIYSFHMPLFFFLSGLFVTKSKPEPLGAFVAGKVRTVAYPYVVWSALQTLMMLPMQGSTHHQVSLWSLASIAYEPIMQFWFLYTLFVIFVLSGALERLGARPWMIFAFAVALYVYARVGSLGSWGIPYSVANYMLYFALGLLVAGSVRDWLTRLPTVAGAALVLVALVCVTIAVLGGSPQTPWVKPFVALVGIAASLVLAVLLDRLHWLRFLNYWGRCSLQIYVGHTMASAAFRMALVRMLGISAAAPHVIGGVAVGIAAPLVLNWFVERVGFRYAYTWPKPAAVPAGSSGEGGRPR